MAPEGIFSIYVVIDDSYLAPRQFGEAASAAAAGGATVIQFRSTRLSDAELLRAIGEVLEVARRCAIPLLINDRVDLARATGADGVHLGIGDMSPDVARHLLGNSAIIGGTAHSLQEARLAVQKGVDYVSVGCIFPSMTKPDLAPAGTKLVKDIAGLVAVPVVAIGGITPGNACAAIEAGASGVAVISYVWQSPDWRAAVAELAAAVSEQKKKIEDRGQRFF